MGHAKNVVDGACIDVPAIGERKILVVGILAIAVSPKGSSRITTDAITIVGAPIPEKSLAEPMMGNLDDPVR